MLTCIARSKQPSAADDASPGQLPDAAAAAADPGAKNPSLKDMALKASGAYRSCGPCGGPGAAPGRVKGHVESDAESDRFYWSYRRQRSSGSNSSYNASQRFVWGKGENFSGDVTLSSGTGSRRKEPAVAVFVEEKEPKEWVAQVCPAGGNDLRRLRFRK